LIPPPFRGISVIGFKYLKTLSKKYIIFFLDMVFKMIWFEVLEIIIKSIVSAYKSDRVVIWLGMIWSNQMTTWLKNIRFDPDIVLCLL
jgi:hypothetical protein